MKIIPTSSTLNYNEEMIFRFKVLRSKVSLAVIQPYVIFIPAIVAFIRYLVHRERNEGKKREVIRPKPKPGTTAETVKLEPHSLSSFERSGESLASLD